jgi:predicted AAA+ superfamily ATPase
MDAFWAKDILELFRLEKRYSFLRFVELLLAQSGGIFEATRYARPCEVSRTTITNYLEVLQATYVVHVIRPYSTYRPGEIVSAPKVYAFDTGFVCYYRGWSSLREEDLGALWEHFVLNEIQAHLQTRRIYYWRDKKGHEVDFVFAPRGKPPIAIECKWSEKYFDPSGLKAFGRRYPEATFFVVVANLNEPYTRQYGPIKTQFVSLPKLIEKLKSLQH